jgi:hypothetical protein
MRGMTSEQDQGAERIRARIGTFHDGGPVKRALVSAFFVLGVLPVVQPAMGAEPTKLECVDANDSAQDLRRAGKLSEARKKLIFCTSTSCPGPVREDCAQRLDDLARLQPTLVFDAKDAAGHDLTEVRVTIDGQPFAKRLDGHALPIDPGRHTFTFEAAGQAPKTEVLVLKEGEKERRERIVIGIAPAARPKPTPATEVTPSPGPDLTAAQLSDESASTGKTQRIAGIAVGAAGVVGLGLGAIFGVVASSKWSSAQKECGSPASCPNYAQGVSDHDSASSAATMSTIGFIAGGALLAGGAALFFTAPSDSSTTAGVQIVPGVSGMTVRGTF